MLVCFVLLLSAGFGLASHLGVLSGIPCVGVGKKLHHVDGLKKSPEHKQKVYSSTVCEFVDLCIKMT